MRIIIGELKRLSNLRKHGPDIADFAEDFDGAQQSAACPSRTGRARFGPIGRFNGAVVVAAIVSPLGSEALSLVSLRVASQRERDLDGL